MPFLGPLCIALAIICGGTVAFGREPLPRPVETIVLTITGEISATNGDGRAEFDMAMLKSMDPVTFETTTIWTEGVQRFTGVALSDLLARVGATGDRLRAMAVNDYAVEIPVESWPGTGPIVAYLNNGAPMSLRDKGPLWIVYPFDNTPDYQTEVVYSRSIWQLDRISVKN